MFLPILLSGFASVIIGWVWYHPNTFGTAWMQMTHVTPEMAERGRRYMWPTTLVAFLASMLLAYVMSYVGVALHIGDWIGSVELGLVSWSGFALPVILGSLIWEQKPFKLFLINALYWLLTFIVIALVLLYTSALFISNPPSAPNASAYGASQ